MAKSKIKNIPVAAAKPLSAKPQQTASAVSRKWYDQLLYICTHKWHSLVLMAVIAGVFYANTLENEYALDDVMFITMNSFTKKGATGIYDLCTKESLTGFIGEGSRNIGGRWRPLSLITFALEWEWFGSDTTPKHFIHVLYYIILCISVLLFLRAHVFVRQPILAFIAAVLFAIHPIHTEVMANLKSRDELLSMLFIVLTLHTSLNYIKQKRISQLLLSIILYGLALLSKENGMALIAILPLTWYVLTSASFKNIVIQLIPYIAVFAIYFALRIYFVPFKNYHLAEVMNAPFLYATPIQRFCTVIMSLDTYLKLLFWPYTMSYDYSYNQIPYVGLSNPYFILSVLIHGALIIGALWYIKSKNLVAYGILFYLLSMFIVSNLVVDTGVVIGERFLFQPSLGWAIALAAAGGWLWEKLSWPTTTQVTGATALLLVISIAAFARTYTRNENWKNDTVLMPHDRNVSPNSARANSGGGSQLIIVADAIKDTTAIGKHQRDSILKIGISWMRRSLQIHPTYIDPLLNTGVAYTRIPNWDSVTYYWNRADSQYKANFITDVINRHPFPIKIFGNKDTVVANNIEEAVPYFIDVLAKDGTPVSVLSTKIKNDDAEVYHETHPKLQYEFFPMLSNRYMTQANDLAINKKDYNASRTAFKKALHYSPQNAELFYNMGGFYFTIKQYDSAKIAWIKCLQINPSYTKAQEGMAAINHMGAVK